MTATTAIFSGARRCALFVALIAPRIEAQTGPVPPCGGGPAPTYPELGAAPMVQYWRPTDVVGDWTPPSCTGWTQPRFSSLVTIAARVRYAGGAESLLSRIGAISQLKGVLYWSFTTGKWKTLILQANAVTAQKDKRARADFTPDEIRNGQIVFLEQSDNLAGKALYRLQVLESTTNRIVFSVENVESMRYLFLTLVHPAEMQSVHFLDRDSSDVWRYYGIMRTGDHVSGLVTQHPESLMNRAVAFFRHYAGIPTDQEPPVARR